MRKQATNSAQRVIRAQVPLLASDWARLCALAAVRGIGRGELAASLLSKALRGVTIVERGGVETSGNEENPTPQG
jgi:hypothetical protein